jgi:outer membrane biogenesis lipoprotein LolB
MKIKLTLSAIALALLPCLPAKADFFTAAVTKDGWWEVDTDSIQHLNNGTARFVSRYMKDSQAESLGAVLVDCRRPRMMTIRLYNLDTQMWEDTPAPRWFLFKRTSVGAAIQTFVCSHPGN